MNHLAAQASQAQSQMGSFHPSPMKEEQKHEEHQPIDEMASINENSGTIKKRGRPFKNPPQ